jgi:catechol 2,3-dioxygenase-like lactoylglutathione lyase family enzyme
LVLTDDLDVTRDFYRDALGLREGPRPPLGFPAGLTQLFLKDPNEVKVEINVR